MLILGRKLNESIMIGDDVEIKVVEIKGDSIKLGIIAPRTIPVHRREVYLTIQKENAEAVSAQANVIDKLKDIVSSKSSKNTPKV